MHDHFMEAYEAIQNENFIEFQRLLLDPDNSGLIGSTDPQGNTLLHIAAEKGRSAQWINFLVEKSPTLLNKKNNIRSGQLPEEVAQGATREELKRHRREFEIARQTRTTFNNNGHNASSDRYLKTSVKRSLSRLHTAYGGRPEKQKMFLMIKRCSDCLPQDFRSKIDIENNPGAAPQLSARFIKERVRVIQAKTKKILGYSLQDATELGLIAMHDPANWMPPETTFSLDNALEIMDKLGPGTWELASYGNKAPKPGEYVIKHSPESIAALQNQPSYQHWSSEEILHLVNRIDGMITDYLIAYGAINTTYGLSKAQSFDSNGQVGGSACEAGQQTKQVAALQGKTKFVNILSAAPLPFAKQVTKDLVQETFETSYSSENQIDFFENNPTQSQQALVNQYWQFILSDLKTKLKDEYGYELTSPEIDECRQHALCLPLRLSETARNSANYETIFNRWIEHVELVENQCTEEEALKDRLDRSQQTLDELEQQQQPSPSQQDNPPPLKTAIQNLTIEVLEDHVEPDVLNDMLAKKKQELEKEIEDLEQKLTKLETDQETEQKNLTKALQTNRIKLNAKPNPKDEDALTFLQTILQKECYHTLDTLMVQKDIRQQLTSEGYQTITAHLKTLVDTQHNQTHLFLAAFPPGFLQEHVSKEEQEELFAEVLTKTAHNPVILQALANTFPLPESVKTICKQRFEAGSSYYSDALRCCHSIYPEASTDLSVEKLQAWFLGIAATHLSDVCFMAIQDSRLMPHLLQNQTPLGFELTDEHKKILRNQFELALKRRDLNMVRWISEQAYPTLLQENGDLLEPANLIFEEQQGRPSRELVHYLLRHNFRLAGELGDNRESIFHILTDPVYFDAEIFDAALKNYPTLIKTVDRHGRTPLLAAIRNNNRDAFERLLPFFMNEKKTYEIERVEQHFPSDKPCNMFTARSGRDTQANAFDPNSTDKNTVHLFLYPQALKPQPGHNPPICCCLNGERFTLKSSTYHAHQGDNAALREPILKKLTEDQSDEETGIDTSLTTLPAVFETVQPEDANNNPTHLQNLKQARPFVEHLQSNGLEITEEEVDEHIMAPDADPDPDNSTIDYALAGWLVTLSPELLFSKDENNNTIVDKAIKRDKPEFFIFSGMADDPYNLWALHAMITAHTSEKQKVLACLRSDDSDAPLEDVLFKRLSLILEVQSILERRQTEEEPIFEQTSENYEHLTAIINHLITNQGPLSEDNMATIQAFLPDIFQNAHMITNTQLMPLCTALLAHDNLRTEENITAIQAALPHIIADTDINIETQLYPFLRGLADHNITLSETSMNALRARLVREIQSHTISTSFIQSCFTHFDKEALLQDHSLLRAIAMIDSDTQQTNRRWGQLTWNVLIKRINTHTIAEIFGDTKKINLLNILLWRLRGKTPLDPKESQIAQQILSHTAYRLSRLRANDHIVLLQALNRHKLSLPAQVDMLTLLQYIKRACTKQNLSLEALKKLLSPIDNSVLLAKLRDLSTQDFSNWTKQDRRYAAAMMLQVLRDDGQTFTEEDIRAIQTLLPTILETSEFALQNTPRTLLTLLHKKKEVLSLGEPAQNALKRRLISAIQKNNLTFSTFQAILDVSDQTALLADNQILCAATGTENSWHCWAWNLLKEKIDAGQLSDDDISKMNRRILTYTLQNDYKANKTYVKALRESNNAHSGRRDRSNMTFESGDRNNLKRRILADIKSGEITTWAELNELAGYFLTAGHLRALLQDTNILSTALDAKNAGLVSGWLEHASTFEITSHPQCYDKLYDWCRCASSYGTEDTQSTSFLDPFSNNQELYLLFFDKSCRNPQDAPGLRSFLLRKFEPAFCDDKQQKSCRQLATTESFSPDSLKQYRALTSLAEANWTLHPADQEFHETCKKFNCEPTLQRINAQRQSNPALFKSYGFADNFYNLLSRLRTEENLSEPAQQAHQQVVSLLLKNTVDASASFRQKRAHRHTYQDFLKQENLPPKRQFNTLRKLKTTINTCQKKFPELHQELQGNFENSVKAFVCARSEREQIDTLTQLKKQQKKITRKYHTKSFSNIVEYFVTLFLGDLLTPSKIKETKPEVKQKGSASSHATLASLLKLLEHLEISVDTSTEPSTSSKTQPNIRSNDSNIPVPEEENLADQLMPPGTFTDIGTVSV